MKNSNQIYLKLKKKKDDNVTILFNVGRDGIEPPTHGFSVLIK